MPIERRLTDADVASVMTPRDFVHSCDEAFRLYGRGEMLNPARRESLMQEGEMDLFRLELPGEWPGRFRGCKVIEERSEVHTGRLGDRTAEIALEDLTNGETMVLDAEYITNMRTGAAGALGARYLAAQPVGRVAILGTGRIARALARCADIALNPEVICATSRSAENRAAFQKDVEPDVSRRVQMVSSVAACVDGADVILASVPTPEPILSAEMVDDRALISVIGGDARTRQLEMPLFLSRAIVPDHAGQVLNSGDFLAVQASGTLTWVRDAEGRIQTVGDAALGALENLRGTGVIVYFSGMAIQDIHAAATAWMRLRDM